MYKARFQGLSALHSEKFSTLCLLGGPYNAPDISRSYRERGEKLLSIYICIYNYTVIDYNGTRDPFGDRDYRLACVYTVCSIANLASSLWFNLNRRSVSYTYIYLRDMTMPRVSIVPSASRLKNITDRVN